MCYIDAMILKGLAIFAVILALAQAPALLSAQSPGRTEPAASGQAPEQARPDCNGVPCEEQVPHFTVTLPAPRPAPWSVHEKIGWAAYIVLAFLGYAGVMLAVSTLKKIERSTAAVEASVSAVQATASAAAAAATAATDAAQAALLHAQVIVNAERPWVLVTAEPTRGVENSFDIFATNRGRTPATVTSSLDQVLFAADEAHLPPVPEFKQVESKARFVPIILLPGESATLKTFSREDARGFCESNEKFARVENWEERLFLLGKVTYNDLIAPAGKEAHATNWCCWYIHGRQKSALVPAGPAEYNAHT
jgi:hypothetical protein